MRIIVLGGFLGSGKTSVLLQLAKHLVAHSDADAGQPVAIIENEIGEVSIDGSLFKGSGVSVKELFSGCICCSLAAGLMSGVKELQDTLDPQYILIEATGLAYPKQVAEPLEKYIADLESTTSITLVDAQRFLQLYDILNPLMVNQLEGADIILINKIDTVDSAELEAVQQTVDGVLPKARIFKLSASNDIPAEIIEQLVGER